VTRHMNDFSDEFSDELEEKIAELVAAGCDRQELLSRLQLFLMAYAAGPERKRVLEDLVGRPARSQLQRIRKVIRMTATEIRKLQLMLPLHPVPFRTLTRPYGEAGERAARLYERLPEILDRYADSIKDVLEKASRVMSKDGMKWALLDYVRKSTGSPRYDLVSGLLYEYATFNGLRFTRPVGGRRDRQNESSEISPEALRDFFKESRYRNLPRDTGQQMAEFCSFLLRVLQ
jgi:hypothetical protein